MIGGADGALYPRRAQDYNYGALATSMFPEKDISELYASSGLELCPRRSQQPSLPRILGCPEQRSSAVVATGKGPSTLAGQTETSRGPSCLLQLHFLAFSGLGRSAGWWERTPQFELFIRAGGGSSGSSGNAKRLRPRIPVPPPAEKVGSGPVHKEEVVDLSALLPGTKDIVPMDERISMRPGGDTEYLQVDVWEERGGLFDMKARKAPTRTLLGSACVPLEGKFNRRPCAWSILGGTDKTEVGLLVCKFSAATAPGPIRSLRVVEGFLTASEITLTWEPPKKDGGATFRGYRAEAREASLAGRDGDAAYQNLRTASAPAVPEPSVTFQNLKGNTAYIFTVWAVSEAGPGPVAEVLGVTAAVEPGRCGLPQVLDLPAAASANPNDSLQGPSRDSTPHIAWQPPQDSGGAPVVAYRVWLRPLFRDSFGEVFPADGWLDLGLSQHVGDVADLQVSPLLLDALPRCIGCLCSVAALNGAGHMGPATRGAPILLRQETQHTRDIHELPGSAPNSSPQSPVHTGGYAGESPVQSNAPTLVALPQPPETTMTQESEPEGWSPSGTCIIVPSGLARGSVAPSSRFGDSPVLSPSREHVGLDWREGSRRQREEEEEEEARRQQQQQQQPQRFENPQASYRQPVDHSRERLDFEQTSLPQSSYGDWNHRPAAQFQRQPGNPADSSLHTQPQPQPLPFREPRFHELPAPRRYAYNTQGSASTRHYQTDSQLQQQPLQHQQPSPDEYQPEQRHQDYQQDYQQEYHQEYQQEYNQRQEQYHQEQDQYQQQQEQYRQQQEQHQQQQEQQQQQQQQRMTRPPTNAGSDVVFPWDIRATRAKYPGY